MPDPNDNSHGGWSNPGSGGEGGAQPDVGEERYTLGAMLGRGGMGDVHAARDQTLGRDVALKELRQELADDITARVRLAREAAITSRLDHPGIVAVHDVGTLPDGRPFYTMRLVRGGTLARALSGPTDRRALIRHVLVAAEAVAAAHDAGIVHRDLKPANILIGAHGETQVGDWGLAAPTLEALPRWAELPGTSATGPVGTEGFMAPEQARGDPADPRHDVWSLGAVLAAVAGTATPELAAIIGRAQAPAIAERYPAADALAADLLAWFEGRRVAAYAYAPSELLRRTVVAYRLPLGVGALGVLAVLGAVGVGWWQTDRSLDRALIAEGVARDRLADLRLEQAVAATEAGSREQAERLALAVLAEREDPLARGVFAAFGRTERPMLLSQAKGPTCLWGVLVETGVICGAAETVTRWEGGRARWTAAVAVVGGALVEGGLAVWDPFDTTTLLDLNTGDVLGSAPLGMNGADWLPQVPPRAVWSGARPLSPLGPSTCPRSMRVLVSAGGLAAAVCESGRVQVTGAQEASFVTAATGDHVASAMVWLGDKRLAIGTLRGRLLVYALDGTLIAEGQTPFGAIARMELSPDGALLAVSGSTGGVGIWRVSSASLIGEVPAARPRAFRFDGGALEVWDGAIKRWRLPGGSPSVARFTAGLADATGDAERVVVTGGSGLVGIVRLADGLVSQTRVGDQVAKAVGIGASGTVVTSMGAPFLTVLGGGPFAKARPLRRVAVMPAGTLGVDLHRGLFFWATPSTPPVIWAPDRAFVDMHQDGERVIVGDALGAVDIVADGVFTRLAVEPDLRGVALRGEIAVVASADALRIFETGAERRISLPGVSLLDVALSADGASIAAGDMAGRAWVWDTASGTLRAELPGHTERVLAVDFLPGGDVITASWDKSVRMWDAASFTAPPAVLSEAVVRAWGAPEATGR